MANNKFTVTVKILDSWTELNTSFNYTRYILYTISDRLYLKKEEL